MPAKNILIQNYHPTATRALIRDFKKIGLKVYCPDNNWGRISYFGDNANLGGELISQERYFELEPGFLLITCKPHEEDMKAIAREHGDAMVLNIAQHGHPYESGLSEIMICPDIITFEMYPSSVRHKLLYFMRPYLSKSLEKDKLSAFKRKKVCSYISMPKWWVKGYPAYIEFKEKYPYACRLHGHETPDGHLNHAECNIVMSESFFTVHFKDDESYGLSCLESMMLGTPILSLNRFMHDKTLGRFFLDGENAILVDDIDEAIERLISLSLDEYVKMSQNAQRRVLELTSDENTVLKLQQAFRSEFGGDIL